VTGTEKNQDILEKQVEKHLILSIGSNLNSSKGDRFYNIKKAVLFLNSSKIRVQKQSSFYETPSYPDKTKPKFINIVIFAKTKLKPLEVLSKTLDIEKKLERVRRIKNEPRTCDIDLIDYNGENINTVDQDFNLTTPHFMMTKRNFVLIPIKEIIPHWIHPVYLKKIDHFISLLSEEEKKSIIKID